MCLSILIGITRDTMDITALLLKLTAVMLLFLIPVETWSGMARAVFYSVSFGITFFCGGGAPASTVVTIILCLNDLRIAIETASAHLIPIREIARLIWWAICALARYARPVLLAVGHHAPVFQAVLLHKHLYRVFVVIIACGISTAVYNLAKEHRQPYFPCPCEDAALQAIRDKLDELQASLILFFFGILGLHVVWYCYRERAPVYHVCGTRCDYSSFSRTSGDMQ
jgi:hypothetical protein